MLRSPTRLALGLRLDPGRVQVHDPRREHDAEDRDRRQDEDREREQPPDDVPRRLASPRLEPLDHDRDDDRRQDPPERELVEDVRRDVRDVVGVGQPALGDPERERHRRQPREPGQPRQARADRHHEGVADERARRVLRWPRLGDVRRGSVRRVGGHDVRRGTNLLAHSPSSDDRRADRDEQRDAVVGGRSDHEGLAADHPTARREQVHIDLEASGRIGAPPGIARSPTRRVRAPGPGSAVVRAGGARPVGPRRGRCAHRGSRR